MSEIEPQQSPTSGFHNPKSTRTASNTQMVQGMVVSLAVHMAIFIAIMIGTITGSQAIEAKTEEQLAPFTPVDLVRLGEERPEDELPRLTNPPPKVEEEDVVVPDQKPKDTIAEKKPEKDKKAQRVQKKPKEEKRNNLLDEFDHDPNRPVSKDLPKGHKEGVPEGTISDAAAANLMRTWNAKVNAAVVRRWQIPRSLGEEKLKELAGRTAVRIRISAEGYIVSFSFARRSGDAHFDSTIERAVKSFMPAYGGGKLPMPEDASLRSKVVSRGVTLTGWRNVVR